MPGERGGILGRILGAVVTGGERTRTVRRVSDGADVTGQSLAEILAGLREPVVAPPFPPPPDPEDDYIPPEGLPNPLEDNFPRDPLPGEPGPPQTIFPGPPTSPTWPGPPVLFPPGPPVAPEPRSGRAPSGSRGSRPVQRREPRGVGNAALALVQPGRAPRRVRAPRERISKAPVLALVGPLIRRAIIRALPRILRGRRTVEGRRVQGRIVKRPVPQMRRIPNIPGTRGRVDLPPLPQPIPIPQPRPIELPEPELEPLPLPMPSPSPVRIPSPARIPAPLPAPSPSPAPIPRPIPRGRPARRPATFPLGIPFPLPNRSTPWPRPAFPVRTPLPSLSPPLPLPSPGPAPSPAPPSPAPAPSPIATPLSSLPQVATPFGFLTADNAPGVRSRQRDKCEEERAQRRRPSNKVVKVKTYNRRMSQHSLDNLRRGF